MQQRSKSSCSTKPITCLINRVSEINASGSKRDYNLYLLHDCVSADVYTSLLPRNIQVVLFSATFPENVVQYAIHFAENANQMTLKHEDLTVEGIKQIYLDCNSDEHKYDVLVKLYGLLTIGSSIIFVRVSVR
jgi:hypothetical protein